MTNKRRIYLYDSTLRDGAQTSETDFSVKDKISIAKLLDDFGIDYIEGGWPGANKKDDEFFANPPKLKNSHLVAFGMTKRAQTSADNDPGLNALTNSSAENLCIFGKSWDFHLSHALKITPKKNLQIINESIVYAKSKKKEVFFDAEHFFDGYKANSKFAIAVIKNAFDSGARWIVLCDTNGGTLPYEIYKIVKEVTEIIPGENLGIHCHNDTDNAVANSLEAVRAGACQIQGTINGIGERCGNANLISLIPTLAIKMNYDIGIKKEKLKNIKKLSEHIWEIINREKNKYAPYVGNYAFAHKGGVHVSAVNKNSASYEHIDPTLVGNKRKIIISDQSGQANIISRLKDIGLIKSEDDINKNKISFLVEKIKTREAEGYAYDSADASFELLARRALGKVKEFFQMISFKTIDERRYNAKGELINVSQAIIKIKINTEEVTNAAEGNGPVSALDLALKEALCKYYPVIKNVVLTDYKVRILNPSAGTNAITRVQIESIDKKGNKWTTIGVSSNIVNASYNALYDSLIFKLLQKY